MKKLLAIIIIGITITTSVQPMECIRNMFCSVLSSMGFNKPQPRPRRNVAPRRNHGRATPAQLRAMTQLLQQNMNHRLKPLAIDFYNEIHQD